MGESSQIDEKLDPGGIPVEADWDVLISYAAEDSKWVHAIGSRLARQGLKAFDPYAIPAQFWGQSVEELVTQLFPARCPIAFVVLSAAYSASDQCLRELARIAKAARANQSSIVLPVRLDDSPLPEQIRAIAALDARTISDEELAKCIVDRTLEAKKSADQDSTQATGSGSTSMTPDSLFEILLKRSRLEIAGLRHMVPYVDAEEIVDDSLFYTVTTLKKRPVSDPLAYFSGVIRKKVIDWLKSEQWRKKVEASRFEPSQPSEKNASPPSPLEEQDEISRARRALVMLSEPDRQFITLVYLEGLTVDETAKRLGIHVAAARSRHFRILSKLRDIMQVEQ